MSQNIDIKKLGTFVIIGLGIIFAFLAGNYVADEDYGALFAVIGGVAAASIFFGLGRRLYLLIPICWGLTGKIGVLPIPFSIAQLVIIASSAYFMADIIFQKKTEKAPFEMIDLWIWINLLYIVTVFFRNPVGFAFLGSGERVGGKPYVDVVLATIAYLILCRVRITPEYARKLPLWILAVAAFTSFAGAVGLFAPEVGIILGRLYSAFMPDVYINDSFIKAGETRFTFFQILGSKLVLYVVAQTNPLSLIHFRHLGSLCLYLSGLAMIFLSGFRNAIISSMLYTTLSVFLRDRFLGAVKIAFTVIVLLCGAILLSFTNINLPLTAQRALCFLPGNWDAQAVADAKDSSDWRFELWEIALTSERYIHNKIFGDGFGFLRSDYERARLIESGVTKLMEGEARQELFLLDGDFHSGPVSTIRFVGYLGLALFQPLLFLVAVLGYRLIRDGIGTPFQYCNFFIGLPIIILPFFSIFIFGDYRSDLVAILFGAGMIKMLSASSRKYNEERAFAVKGHATVNPEPGTVSV
jgi:hypothetical protein